LDNGPEFVSKALDKADGIENFYLKTKTLLLRARSLLAITYLVIQLYFKG
tara:strand:+ start:23569 stop:23718 length:150 start_codon:yes stop_codon:yes gene_type:complete